MGDVVFAPLYEVLKRRGVRFEFFHRLENIKLPERLRPGERAYVEALEFAVQAEVAGRVPAAGGCEGPAVLAFGAGLRPTG